MKRLRSYGDDLDSVGGVDKGVLKDWGRRDQDLERSSSSSHHRRFHSSKIDTGRKGLSSSSSYDRVMEDDREASRSLRKRLDHDSDGFDRRKSYDRYRDRDVERVERGERGVSISPSPRSSYGGGDRMHRSESFSFSGSRREFPKGFRSERERSRREESVSSWRRLCGSKDVVVDDDVRSGGGGGEFGRSNGRVHVRSPSVSREVVKSGPQSRGSSRSSEVKKSDGVQGESSSSEMEEGELEPEPEHEPEPEFNSKQVVEPDDVVAPSEVNGESDKECNKENRSTKDTSNDSNDRNQLSQDKFEIGMDSVSNNKKDSCVLEMNDAGKVTGEFQECESNSAAGTSVTKEVQVLREEEGVVADQDTVPSIDLKVEDSAKEEKIKDVSVGNGNSLHLEEGQNEEKCTGLEVEVEDVNCVDSKEPTTVGNRRPEVTLNLISDNLNGKDKGKSLAVSPSHEANSVENGRWVEKDFLVCRDNAMEGPSSRGFELFSTSTLTRPEKTSNFGASKDGKLKSEPLELSLGLPDVLLPLPSHDPNSAPSSPSRAMSVQSLPSTYRTTSDGFTGSMSFSGSQTFFHNPSCSLTQNSFENYEQSVGSHSLFQGIDQVSHINNNRPGQSLNEPKRKETSAHQRILSNGNGYHAQQTSQGIMYSQAMQGQHLRISEGSSGIPIGLDRQSSLRRQLSGIQLTNHTEIRSPTQSVGSRETRSEFSKDKKQTLKERSGSLYRSNSQREMEQLVIGGTGFVERIIGMIVSEPVQVMARRIQEMAEQSITFVKDRAGEIIVNKDKRGQLHAFQEALQNRSDLTLETLLKSHRAQLEILVAFKTGLQDFLRKANAIASSDLAEIFMNLKCRNLTCLNLLPVDECDCKVCVKKNGFCSACMCLICSKFDMASNTCSWVGCDVCLHWCHTECGIRESYIRNGLSVNGAQEKTEMQFHCVACNHPSELFGFVKEVFRTCGKEWKVEALSKELEYVKRIFAASNDTRGKQLHHIAERMIARLENKSNLPEVYSYIMRFFTGSESEFGKTSTPSLKEMPHKNPGEESNGIGRPSHEAMWLTSVSTENAPHGENASAPPPRLDWDQMAGRSGNQDLRMNVVKKPVVDELESIVRIKLAEAKMFQARADDARREAEGLKRIAVAKNEKIEEEYSSRIKKLRLADTEERRKRKLEELQVLEREHREYFSMKMRMETDIRDLLLKMEATKQNFIT